MIEEQASVIQANAWGVAWSGGHHGPRNMVLAGTSSSVDRVYKCTQAWVC